MPTKNIDGIELSILLPAYLEEENLRILLPRIVDVAEELTDRYEVIVIDKARSLDGTKGVCQKFGKVFHVSQTGGDMFGDAVRTGIQRCRGEYVIFMDADGSHSPDFIKPLYEARETADVVVASRYVEGGYTENTVVLVWMSYILNWSYRIVLGLKCNDVSTSYKLYRGDQIRSLQLKCKNFDIVEEILFKLNRQFSISIRELPFTFKKRMFGDTKRNLPLFFITYFSTLVRLRFSDR